MAKRSSRRTAGKSGLSKKASAKPSSLDARGALLKAGAQVFAAQGFAGATVKDLADQAGVNVSLVSYHFGGKEGLYRACLETFGTERIETTERVLRPPQSGEDFKIRLRLFAEDFIGIHLREPHLCKMIHRSLDNLDQITAEVFKNVFFRIFAALNEFIDGAQKAGVLRGPERLDTEITASLMIGSLMHLLRSQEIARLLGKRTIDDSTFREAVIDQWVDNFTAGIFADKSTDRNIDRLNTNTTGHSKNGSFEK